MNVGISIVTFNTMSSKSKALVPRRKPSKDKENSKDSENGSLTRRTIKSVTRSHKARRALDAMSNNVSMLSPTIQRQLNKHAWAVEMLLAKDRKRDLRIRNALLKHGETKQEVVPEQTVETKFETPKKTPKKEAMNLASPLSPPTSATNFDEGDIYAVKEHVEPLERECFYRTPFLNLVPCL